MASHSIQISRAHDGWRWALIDLDGRASAAGLAANQDKAMHAAWTAALAHAEPGARMYPDILVDGRPRLDLAA